MNLDCYPCMMRQIIDLLSFSKVKGKKRCDIFFKVYDYLRNRPLEEDCLRMGNEIYLIVKEETGIEDPCKEIKGISNKASLKIYLWLKNIVQNSRENLKTALKIAIAGNVIDVGAGIDLKLKESVHKTIKQDIDKDCFSDFVKLLSKANLILFLADNAGEVVFDKVLLEELNKISKNKINYIVKEEPFLNDAMEMDAVFAGIDKVANIISNGSGYAGTQIDNCGKSFLEKFSKADLIISKGYANYMSLRNIKVPIFFMLKAKCPITQKEFHTNKGFIIFIKSKNFNSPYIKTVKK